MVSPHGADRGTEVAYVLFALQGVGMLFPYNAFITCTGYYETAFAGTPYARSAVGLFVLAFTVLGLAGLLAGVVFESLSQRVRVVVPLIGQLALFLVVAALTPVPILSPDGLFAVLLGCACACALLSAALQGGILAFSSTLPPIYTNGVMVGQAISGLVVAVANVAILFAQHEPAGASSSAAAARAAAAAESRTQRHAAFAYYLVAAGVMAACVAGYSALVAMHASGRLGVHAPIGESDADAEAGGAVDGVTFGVSSGGSVGRLPGSGDFAPGRLRPALLLQNPLGDSDAPEHALDDADDPRCSVRSSPAPRWGSGLGGPIGTHSRTGLWHRVAGGAAGGFAAGTARGGGAEGGVAHRVPAVEPALPDYAGAGAGHAAPARAEEEEEEEGRSEGAPLSRAASADSACAAAVPRDASAASVAPAAAYAASSAHAAHAPRTAAETALVASSRALLRARGRTLARIRLDGLALLATFAVTLAVFPAVTARIQPRGLWPSPLPPAPRPPRSEGAGMGGFAGAGLLEVAGGAATAAVQRAHALSGKGEKVGAGGRGDDPFDAEGPQEAHAPAPQPRRMLATARGAHVRTSLGVAPPGPGSLYSALFVPCLFVLFNLGDVLGRWLAALRPTLGARKLLAISVARCAFVPLTLACAIGSRPGGAGALGGVGGAGGMLRMGAQGGSVSAVPAGVAAEAGALGSDLPALALLLLLGVSNGYCASCAFMAAPLRVTHAEREWVGRTMPLFLNVGLTVGSLLALLLEASVE